jgi:hypothetical protein
MPDPSNDRPSREESLEQLLVILVRVVEAQAGTDAGPDQRLLDAEGLILKFVGHVTAALVLSRSTSLPDLGIRFFDPGSISVLARSAVETFLVFHHVFVAPTHPAEADIRYMAWQLGGLADRQRFPLHSPAGEKLLEHEAAQIAALRAHIQDNPLFATLSEKQRKQILRGRWRAGGDGQDIPWKALALNAGFNEDSANGIYHYLCGYAHSSWISVLQLRQARTREEQGQLMGFPLSSLGAVVAHMIKAVCRVFPKSLDALEADPKAQELVEIWAYVTSTDDRPDIDWTRFGFGDTQ